MIKYKCESQWLQKGNIHFWEYKSGRGAISGFHLSWNEEGKNSFIELLTFLHMQANGIYRTIKLKAPDRGKLKVPNCGFEIETKSKLKILVSKFNYISIESTKYELGITLNSIEQFMCTVSQVESGRELCFDVGDKFINLWW
jgi:hypothetical protein